MLFLLEFDRWRMGVKSRVYDCLVEHVNWLHIYHSSDECLRYFYYKIALSWVAGGQVADFVTLQPRLFLIMVNSSRSLCSRHMMPE